MRLRGVLFDAAGTLIETARPVGQVYAEHAAAHGVRLPAARIADAFARILAQAPPRVFPDAPPAAIAGLEREWWRRVLRSTFLATDGTARFDDFEAFFAELFAHYATPEAWRARPGALAALAQLRGQGLATGCLSNFDGRLPAILAGLGLAARLDVVLLPGELRVAKPDPRCFELALARLGLAPGECAFVGDDAERDLAAARAAGLAAIDVASLATLELLPARLRDPESKVPA